MRFIILVFALLATGLGLMRVTSAKDQNKLTAISLISTPPAEDLSVPFDLILSAPAEEIQIETNQIIRPSVTQFPISGKLQLHPSQPSIALKIRWKSAPAAGEHRFAKLRLEAPGHGTLTHVFDATADIDDFLELPFPIAK